ncbi:alcohol dehydrogenase catalytic domain-containing protein [Microtetraspora sp. AC03309]|uniref:alcohol dehydrogenase catalytic domain-containing protein n=1 Tax=Microtetraspora sp. AC03309 TaxID=2779376 RepID=UPI001E49B876|nr:zinc-binding dehydrogenase [Microtetraspora sp. AC03309]
MTKVLVSGATGTIGRPLVNKLEDAGADVRTVTRELTDPIALEAALDGVDAVFLLWPFASAEGAREVVDLIGARRLVYLSSAAARPHEVEIERLIAGAAREWTVLRPHAFAANTLRWAEQVRAGVVRQPYGEAAFSPIHERDVAAVAVRALLDEGHHGAVYTLTGPRPLTQREQARAIGAAIGRSVRWEEEPPEEARLRLLGLGWPAPAVDGMLRGLAEPGPATGTVEEVTGAPASTFETWASEHAADFLGTMRAARIHEYGDASVISLDEVPVPKPGPGEVLIRVAATSFNPSEVGLRMGLLEDTLGVTLPHTLGWDVAGTVVTGAGDLAPGDRVFGLIDGAAAEYAVAKASVLARAPERIPLADAAAVPVAGLTAWQAVFEHARIGRGSRVLINGAGGGVGLFAVQLAKYAGAHVVATAGPRSAAAVRALGADEVVDYTSVPLPGGNDVLINLVADVPASVTRLAKEFVSITQPIEHPRAVQFVARNDPGQLAELVALIDKGVVHVNADVRPLESLADLHRAAERGLVRGKVIVEVEA